MVLTESVGDGNDDKTTPPHLLPPGVGPYQFPSCQEDPFTLLEDPAAEQEDEKLDSEWQEYARRQFGEDPNATAALVSELRRRASEETDFVLPEEDSFYIKVLRAGQMSIDGKGEGRKRGF